ncbi:hypothetical protein BRPE64_ACDS05410 [Caballeronia insecticola]|uniref:Uncharacterized protein n=1 Tax=Caballeronia insecticola TaxID=758793 RepID=R4WN63_9BURK|nr:hypothetical protein BRPE64_ACDS05410 [Caballeronia insecticola]
MCGSGDAQCPRLFDLRMVKPITISEIDRKPLIDGRVPAYQYVNLVLDAVLRADTIDVSHDNRPVRHASRTRMLSS